MNFYWIRRSIRMKLAVFMMLAIAIPMLASLLITNTRTADYVARIRFAKIPICSIKAKRIWILIFNPSFKLHSPPTPVHDLYRTLETGRSDYLVDNQIFVSLQIMSSSIKEIYQVYLHSPLAEKSYVFSRGSTSAADRLRPLLALHCLRITFSIQPVHSSSTYGIRSAPLIVPKPVITVIRPILQIPSDKQIGTLALDITTDVIDSICAQLTAATRRRCSCWLLTGRLFTDPNATAGYKTDGVVGRAPARPS